MPIVLMRVSSNASPGDTVLLEIKWTQKHEKTLKKEYYLRKTDKTVLFFLILSKKYLTLQRQTNSTET